MNKMYNCFHLKLTPNIQCFLCTGEEYIFDNGYNINFVINTYSLWLKCIRNYFYS